MAPLQAGQRGPARGAAWGYFAFFSIFPALALGFTVFGVVLGGRPDLLEAIGNTVNESLPGMVRTARTPGGIIGLSAPAASTLTITGIVSALTLLYSGSGWLAALRTGIRAVFGLQGNVGNVVSTKLRDLGVLATLGVGVALSAVLTSSVGGLAGRLAGWVGLPGEPLLVTVVGPGVGLLLDTLLLVLLVRVLSGVPLPWANVRGGALVGAAALTVLKFFGGQLIAHATGSPLLGAVAVAVGLLFWRNLMARVVLLSAAWAANDVHLARLASTLAILPSGPGPRTARPCAARTGSGSRQELSWVWRRRRPWAAYGGPAAGNGHAGRDGAACGSAGCGWPRPSGEEVRPFEEVR